MKTLFLTWSFENAVLGGCCTNVGLLDRRPLS